MNWPIFLLSLALSTSAWAWPSRQAGSVTAGGTPAAVTVSADGRHVALLGRDGKLRVWNRQAFSAGATAVDVDGCTAPADAVFAEDNLSSDVIYVACGERTVVRFTLDGSSTPPTLSRDTDLTLGLTAGAVEQLDWVAGDDYVHAVVVVSATWELHRIAVDDGTIDGGSLPLGGAGTVGGFAVNDGGTAMVIAGGDGMVHLFSRSGSSYSGTDLLVRLLGGWNDVAAGDGFSDFLLSDGDNGEVWRLSPSGVSTVVSDGFDGPKAVLWEDSNSLLVADGDGNIEVIDAEGGGLADIALSGGNGLEMAGLLGGELVFVGSAGGNLGVLQDAPWISGLRADPDSVQTGEAFTVVFTSDMDAAWELRVGGDGASGSGSLLANGEADAAVEQVVPASEADLPQEGANRLWVHLTGDGGTSVDGIVVTRDAAPAQVTGIEVGPADQALIVGWSPGDEPDIDHWLLYLSDAPWDSDTRPTFAVSTDDGSETYPRTVVNDGTDGQVDLRIDGLTNGTLYYVAVLAVDEGGQEGPMSALVSANPAATCSAAECAGDTGGCSCDVVMRTPLAAWAVLPVLASLLRRARRR